MSKTSIKIGKIELNVQYDYEPEEQEVRYCKDGSGYPGSPERFNVRRVEWNGQNVTQLVDELYGLDSIEDSIEDRLSE